MACPLNQWREINCPHFTKCSLDNRRKQGRGKEARTQEKNGIWGLGMGEHLLLRPPFFHFSNVMVISHMLHNNETKTVKKL